ncbi:MAG: hypothetical protein P8X62_05260 [Flavobacteriaceae bacterium]
MKNIGIWLDKEKAIIVSIQNEIEQLSTVMSEIEHYRPRGGSGTRFKGGPQDVIQDSKFLERELHQLKRYFHKIVKEIRDAKAIVIFGPAETGAKLNKELFEHFKELHTKVKGVRTTDSMTNNQLKAWVRDFFQPK